MLPRRQSLEVGVHGPGTRPARRGLPTRVCRKRAERQGGFGFVVIPSAVDSVWLAGSLGRPESAPFTAADVAALSAHMGTVHAPAGAPLMAEGDSNPTVWVVKSGEVELYRRQGQRRVVIAVLSCGDVVGDVPVLSGQPPAFSARALTDTVLVRLSVPDLHRFLLEHPAVSLRFAVSLAGRLQRMQARLLHIAGGDLHHQVAQLLLEQTGGGPGEVSLSQGTIAGLLGASRPWVNRVLNDLAGEGLLRLGYRSITVLDAPTLSRR